MALRWSQSRFVVQLPRVNLSTTLGMDREIKLSHVGQITFTRIIDIQLKDLSLTNDLMMTRFNHPSDEDGVEWRTQHFPSRPPPVCDPQSSVWLIDPGSQRAANIIPGLTFYINNVLFQSGSHCGDILLRHDSCQYLCDSNASRAANRLALIMRMLNVESKIATQSDIRRSFIILNISCSP